MPIGVQNGTTYYSEFKNIRSITNPVIDNDVKMKYKGFFVPNWAPQSITFDNFGYGLQKTISNRGGLFCDDASKLFSLQKGYVSLLLDLPYSIINGVYQILDDSLDSYILFGINIGRSGISQPSIYAAFTDSGIRFEIWSSYGRFFMIDTYTNAVAGISKLEFMWDNNGIDDFDILDFKSTMCIRVNDANIVIGNAPIANDDIGDLSFWCLDTFHGNSNMECIMKNLLIANELPQKIQDEWHSSSSSSSISSSSSSSDGFCLYWDENAYTYPWTDIVVAKSYNYRMVTENSGAGLGSLLDSYDGTTWTVISGSAFKAWTCVALSSDGSTSCAAGLGGNMYFGQTYHTGGSFGVVSGSPSFSGIAMSDDGLTRTAVANPGRIYKWDGPLADDWTAIATSPVNTDKNWLCVSMSSDGSIQAAIEDGTAIYLSTNSGANWSSVGPAGDWKKIEVSYDGSYQIACTSTQIYITDDNWATSTIVGATASYTSVSISSDGQYQSAVTTGGKIHASSDYGATWHELDSNRNWTDISVSGDGQLQVAIVNGGYIYECSLI